MTVGLKNGGTLVLEHDAAGHPVTRTLEVRRDAFAQEDVAATQEPVRLVTASAYNRDGALVSRTEPSGRATTWEYTEDDPDPRNRGNAVRRTETPSPGAHADQPSLVTTWTFDEGFQVPLNVTDPRGNTTTYRYDKRGNRVATAHPPVEIQPVGKAGARAPRQTLELETRYAYNSGGQLIRNTDVDGTVTTFDHYPAADPTGAGGPGTAISDPEAPAGYLAAVTNDAGGVARRTACRWDAWGNLAEVIDATGNAVRQRFDALGRLVEVRGREPVGGTVTYRYDESGNEVEFVQPFNRLEVDEATGATVVRTGTIRELRAYDALDQLVARTIAGGEQRVTERFLRDADGRVVRLVQPTGIVTALEYDERGLLVAMTRGAGTRRRSRSGAPTRSTGRCARMSTGTAAGRSTTSTATGGTSGRQTPSGRRSPSSTTPAATSCGSPSRVPTPARRASPARHCGEIVSRSSSPRSSTTPGAGPCGSTARGGARTVPRSAPPAGTISRA